VSQSPAAVDAVASLLRPHADRHAPDLVTAGLLAHCAALLAWYVRARIAAAKEPGEPLSLAALVERFEVAAEVRVTAERLEVVMPMTAVDVDMRRAGLDFDPGYAPWLKRRVEFVYEERESSVAPCGN
jgi:hypothetical protein